MITPVSTLLVAAVLFDLIKNPHILFTILGLSFGTGIVGSLIFGVYFEGIKKKHNLNSYIQFYLVLTHILPMYYMYLRTKNLKLNNKYICFYILIPIIATFIYSKFFDYKEHYPEIPDYIFYVIYPISIIIPFVLR